MMLWRIEVGKDKVTVRYTLPMSPKNSTEEMVVVLPFIHKSEPCGIRTHDTLIKSQVLYR